MMRILKEIGLEVPAPQFFEKHKEKMRQFNPEGFYEDPELQETGVQSDNYKGMAVKLFGYALHKTPAKYVDKVILCTREREAAVESSIDVFDALYTETGKPNHAKGIEDVYFDTHYRLIYEFLEGGTEFLEVSLENMQLNPAIELRRVVNFLESTVAPVIINELVKSIHKQPVTAIGGD